LRALADEVIKAVLALKRQRCLADYIINHSKRQRMQCTAGAQEMVEM
jgi:hypothetical protein